MISRSSSSGLRTNDLSFIVVSRLFFSQPRDSSDQPRTRRRRRPADGAQAEVGLLEVVHPDEEDDLAALVQGGLGA